jgi:putative membrane protein
MKMSNRRLHPLTVVLGFLKFVKELIAPLLVFLISALFRRTGSGGSMDTLFFWETIAAIGFVVIATFWGWLTWYRTTYSVDEREIRVEQGVLIRKKKYIPFERIQTIDLSEGLLHRLFGVVKVQIETAGGTKPEATLSAVTWEEAERIKETWRKPELHVQSQGGAGGDDIPEEESQVRRALTPQRLLIAGATSGKFGLILAITAPVLSQLAEVIDIEQIVEENFVLPTVTVILILFSIFFFFSWLFSIIGTILQYANFGIVRTEKRIYVKSGFIARRQFTIPLRRIQAIRMVEGIVRGPLGFVTLYIESAGSINVSQAQTQQSVLFPLIRKDEVNDFLTEILPEYAVLEEASWNPLPSKAKWGYMLRMALPTLIFVIPLCWLVPWGWISLVIIPLAAGFGLWKFHSAGWALLDTHLMLRKRMLSRTTAIIPHHRIQWDQTSQSLFQRRSGLSMYQLAVASGRRFSLRGLDYKTSHSFQQWARNKA